MEIENCNFQYVFLISIVSVIHEAKFIEFATHLVECHLEGTVSQIVYLGPSFYFMKCRMLQKMVKSFPFFYIK